MVDRQSLLPRSTYCSNNRDQSLFTTTMAFFGADMNVSTDQVTWFTFYCHHENRPYYYDPISGFTTWSLPKDGILSSLPGAPVDSPPPPSVIYHRPLPPQPISPSTSSSAAEDVKGASSAGSDNSPPEVKSKWIREILLGLLCVTNLISWGHLVSEPACWDRLRDRARCWTDLAGIETKNPNELDAITNSLEYMSSYSKRVYEMSMDNVKRNVQTVSTQVDDHVHFVGAAATYQWQLLHKQGSSWMEQMAEAFRSLGTVVPSKIVSISSRIEPQTGPSSSANDEAASASNDQIDTVYQAEEFSLEEFSEAVGEIQDLNHNVDLPVSEQNEEEVELTLMPLNKANDMNDRDEVRLEVSILDAQGDGEQQLVVAASSAMDGIEVATEVDQNDHATDGRIVTNEKEILFFGLDTDEASDAPPTTKPAVEDEESNTGALDQAMEETTGGNARSEILTHEIFEEHENTSEDEGIAVGDTEGLDEAAVHDAAGTLNDKIELVFSEEVRQDIWLDHNEYTVHHGDANFDNLVNSGIVVAVEEEDDQFQLQDRNGESPYVSEDSGESPEKDDGDISFEAVIEPLETQPSLLEDTETSLQRIVRMAHAAGIVIDPTIAKVGSMVNRPPLLTAKCPGPLELQALLSHCKA